MIVVDFDADTFEMPIQMIVKKSIIEVDDNERRRLIIIRLLLIRIRIWRSVVVVIILLAAGVVNVDGIAILYYYAQVSKCTSSVIVILYAKNEKINNNS